MTFKYAIQRTAHTVEVINRQADNFYSFFETELADMRVSPEKVGKTFIPGAFRLPSRTADNVSEMHIAVFDIDQKPEDDIITLEEIEDVAIDMGLEHAVYTSYSNTPECPRFRLLIPFSRPVYPEEYPFIMSALVEDFDEFLDGRFSKVLDRCWKNELSRCYYTFTVHPDRLNGAISFFNPGNTLDVDETKIRQSTYGQDIEYASTSKARKSGTFIGAVGRSYELTRLLGAMFRGSTEEEIFQRLIDFDAKENAGDEYFRDTQYNKHKPKPGENLEQARIRSARSFVKTHISWLRRKVKSDFKIINKPGKNVGAVAQHDAVIQIYKAENIEKAGKETTKLSCKIISGEHAGAIFWHTLFGTGYSDQAIQVSQDLADRAKKASKQEINSIKDMIKLSGKIVKARIKYKPGTNGFPAQNEIGNIYIE
ncbi:hypothetical protein [Pseudomonas sp. WS 5011]|jgi:hypothetical protein|uniref:hypothetical protein n=1 Tax=Pseudomonas sp. WS 5011 TaxID=2717477 RepID=UPI00147517C3|nr:hypothetical protein [Pseudomonas sp. WS 5011]NMY53293.1 hypothetical protein [Pseudomonas sp. WS 5011]